MGSPASICNFFLQITFPCQIILPPSPTAQVKRMRLEKKIWNHPYACNNIFLLVLMLFKWNDTILRQLTISYFYWPKRPLNPVRNNWFCRRTVLDLSNEKKKLPWFLKLVIQYSSVDYSNLVVYKSWYTIFLKLLSIQVTAEDESGIRIWDLRMLKAPITELPGHAHW